MSVFVYAKYTNKICLIQIRLRSLRCSYKEILQHWLLNMRPVKIQMQADLNLRWAHMSEGTSSYIAAEIS